MKKSPHVTQFSTSYSTEPSAWRILDSHTQHLIRLTISSLAVVWLRLVWFATTLPPEFSVKPVVFRRCIRVPVP